MSKIYKYASIDSGLLILKNQNVVVSNPSKFNDPFDSELLVRSRDIKLGLQMYVDFLLENELLDCCNKVINSGISKQTMICKRFVKRINNRRSKSKKRGSYYPLISTQYIKLMTKLFGFTIPKENKDRALESFKYLDELIDNKATIEIKKLITEIPNDFRISCFSKRPDIAKMWAHYANKHNGICIEYENIKNTYPVEYTKNEKYVNFFKFVRTYLASVCSNGIDCISEKKLVSMFPILNKSKDWKEEQEVRMIVSSKDQAITSEVINGNEVDLFPIGKPSRLIIGIGVSEKDKNDVIDYCMKKQIPLSICKKKNYKIVVEDYKREDELKYGRF